jgi:VacB/RNase II family 3'-5' exoribonuclease
MTTHTPFPFNLSARAHQAMIDAGFVPDFPPEAMRQLQAIEAKPPPATSPEIRDLRSLLWSSIDNTESRDLDQVEYAERLANGDIRVLVGIADVDAFVPHDSPIDRHAGENTTSVYLGVAIYPMLPEQLSTDTTSLLDNEDRLALVIEMVVDSQGNLTSSGVSQALLRNDAKLSYEGIGAWLENGGTPPAEVARIAGLEAQLRLQDEAAERLHAHRESQGALDFETIEAQPVMQDGHVVGLKVTPKNRARYLIENFMIAANTAMATYLETSGVPSIQRVVRSPERWDRIVALAAQMGEHLPSQPDSRALSGFLARRKAADPAHFPDLSLSIVKLLGPGEYTVVRSPLEHAGHFGLAVHNYTHSTAPNRRYADLVTQRLLKAIIRQAAPPYSEEALTQIAQRCTEREDAARKVERLMRKVAAAVLLSNRIGEVFDAIVTGASEKGTYARVISPPVEGRIVQGEHGLDVGDRVRVRLIRTEPWQGFIDFAASGTR